MIFQRNSARILLRRCFFKLRRDPYSSADITPKVAIVGSGPAGFYTAQHLLKRNPAVLVDIYEKCPVPFGLVRYGVAPDHPDVKNVINSFTQTASNDRCSFIGNVNVGQDVQLGDLLKSYTAVVLAYGADDDRRLDVPGEELTNVVSARQFVGWYNGLPQDRELQPNLDTDTAVVLGHGNVALDVARILLSPLDSLSKTDITAHSFDMLSRSKVKRVVLVGRRGPLHVAFTTAELREMLRLPGCRPVFQPQDFQGFQDVLKGLPRPRKRLTELMNKAATEPDEKDKQRWAAAERECHFKFLRSPVRFKGNSSGHVEAVEMRVNTLQGSSIEDQKAVATAEREVIETGLVLRSVGYRSVALDASVPFDPRRGLIPNQAGRVSDVQGLYCSGWVKRGPVGVIVSTMNDGFETADTILQDIKEEKIKASGSHDAKENILSQLKRRGVHPVSFSDWNIIDSEEVARGHLVGKPREKIVDFAEMLSIVRT